MCNHSAISRSLGRLVFAVLVVCCWTGVSTGSSIAAEADDWPVSCFCYRDVNRNGIYDIPDRPFAGLTIELLRPDGSTVNERSNVSGFANFKSSLQLRPIKDIHSAGTHRFRAMLPDGMELTSGEANQRIEVREHAKIAGGLALERTCTPFGIAPTLKVSGVVAGSSGANLPIRASVAGGVTLSKKTGQDGLFSFSVTPGMWNIALIAPDGGEISRQVTVTSYPVRMAAAPQGGTPLAPIAGPARTVNFDDLTTSDTLYEIPSGYGELGWQNWVATHQKLYSGAGYVNATTSGEYAAYTSSGYPATIQSEKPFDVAGFNIGVAWPRGEEDDIVIKAWRGSSQVYEDRLRARTTGPLWFDADYRGITRLELAHENFERIVIDDFRYRLGQ